MKKFLPITLLFCLAIFGVVKAAAPTAPTIYGPVYAVSVYGWNVATESKPTQIANSNSSSKDSLNGVDTITLLNKFPIEPGWEYMFQVSDSTGAADTMHFWGTSYMSDGKTVLRTIMYDSVGGSNTYLTSSIPIGSTTFATLVTLKAIKRIATLKAKIWRFELWRRQLRVK